MAEFKEKFLWLVTTGRCQPKRDELPTTLDLCEEFRDEGHAWFEEGQYWRAGERYRKVLVYLDYTFADNDEEARRVKELSLPCILNLAICKLKTGEYREAETNASYALSLDDKLVKALYVRAKARRMRDEFELAEKDIIRALELVPQNMEVRREQIAVRNAQRHYARRQRQVSQAMFGGGKLEVSRSKEKMIVEGSLRSLKKEESEDDEEDVGSEEEEEEEEDDDEEDEEKNDHSHIYHHHHHHHHG
jgi:tetratricopeptide (TPR) repeat protein